MKKQLLFSTVAFVAVAAVAQQPYPKVQFTTADQLATRTVKVSETVPSVVPVYASSRKSMAPTANFTLFAYNSNGVYSTGLSRDYGSTQVSYSVGSLVSPSYFAPMTSEVDPAPTFTWTYTTQEGTFPMATDANGRGVLNDAGGQTSVLGSINYPVVTAVSGSDQVVFDKGASDYTVTTGAVFMSLLNRNANISMFDGSYDGTFSTYFYGDEETLAWIGADSPYQADYLVQIFNAPTQPMVVSGGYINVLAVEESGSTQVFTTDDKWTFELWTAEYDETGTPVLHDCLATAGAGSENVQQSYDPKNGSLLEGYYALNFNFTTIDPIFGIPVASPVVVPTGTRFAIVVRGLAGDTNARIGYGPTGKSTGGVFGPGNAYFVMLDDDRYTYLSMGTDYPTVEFVMGLDADLPAIAWAVDEMTSDVSGGYLYAEMEGQQVSENLFYSSMPYTTTSGTDNYVMEMPDWVSLDTMKEYGQGYSSSGAYLVSFVAQPLPSGETGRSGYITISCPKTGQSWGIKVGQGEWDPDSMPSGVETAQAEATKAYVAGEELHLAYGEGFDRADVYNVSGVRVASYSLPAGGQYVAPVSGLADGVYVVVLGGEKTETLKFVK